jgi:predicted membrane-bound spermidine synthase
MSLTPNEALTQRKLVKYAKGDVAIAGMGLGWLAQTVLKQSRVKSLTVVELDKAVLNYFGKQVKAVAKSVNKPLKLVHCDAYDYDWMKHEQALWDIWLAMRDGADDRRFWRICYAMREAGKSCHGWYTTKPTNDCIWEMKREDREKAEKEGKNDRTAAE